MIFIQDFRITQIGDGAYSILDAGDSSFYVIEGTDKSVVIDTGISPGKKILPTIRSLTKKPLSLVVTHAHIDHFHHMDEFDDVYMCHDEFKMHDKTLKAMMAGKNLKLHETQDVQTGAEINIGNNVLEIFKVPGHTPGSIVVLEKKNNFLFTGDAIGSGYGVWMQLEDSLPLVQYRDNLILLAQWLSNRGGLMSFWGGHNYQQFQSTLILGYNPLNMGLLWDLIDLVNRIVNGKIVGRNSNVDKIFDLEPVLYASFGRAEIQYMPSKIHV